MGLRVAGTPLVKRPLASLCSLSRWAVRRLLMPSKVADSSKMVRVPLWTSVWRPPMTPARAIGPPVSVIKRVVSSRTRS